MMKAKNRWVLVAAIVASAFAGMAALQATGEEGLSPEHKRLDALVGEWDTVVKLWLNGPDRGAIQANGWSTGVWKLDGRFVEMTTENPSNGASYFGLGYIGYDVATGVYETLWMNNQSTGMAMEEGRYNPGDNTIHTSGSYADPSTGMKVFTRTELTITGPDSHMVSAYTTLGNGREFKQVEITFTRKK
jgi:hypothetical protein